MLALSNQARQLYYLFFFFLQPNTIMATSSIYTHTSKIIYYTKGARFTEPFTGKTVIKKLKSS